MSPLYPARRRAERFDSLVEGARRSSDDTTVDASTAELLELVGALRSVPEPQARPAFVADLREQLMLAAETELTHVPAAERHRDDVARLTIKPTRTRRERRVGVALGAVAIMGATTSMAVASQSALPGDALYPVKRAIENTQAGFAVGDDAKGETMLGNASERLDEVGKLSHKSKPDAKLVQQTLDTYSAQFSDGGNALLSDFEQNGNPASIAQVHENAADGIAALSALTDVIPPAAHTALLGAASTVLNLDAQAALLCPDPECGPGILDAPANLVASAADAVGDVTDAIAGGQLPSTVVPSATPESTKPDPKGNGGKGGKPSGLNPPETPIDVTPSDAAPTGLGDVLPGGSTGNAGTSGGSHGGGKGGKHKPVDLTPVTDTVNDVVAGVVQGVTGVLNGLTGK